MAATSTNQHFLAFQQADELQVWDISHQAKCLVRLTPAQISASAGAITSFAFSSQQVRVHFKINPSLV